MLSCQGKAFALPSTSDGLDGREALHASAECKVNTNEAGATDDLSLGGMCFDHPGTQKCV